MSSKFLDILKIKCQNCKEEVKIQVESVDSWKEAKEKENVICPNCGHIIAKGYYA